MEPYTPLKPHTADKLAAWWWSNNKQDREVMELMAYIGAALGTLAMVALTITPMIG